jgi:hypothetical protein
MAHSNTVVSVMKLLSSLLEHTEYPAVSDSRKRLSRHRPKINASCLHVQAANLRRCLLARFKKTKAGSQAAIVCRRISLLKITHCHRSTLLHCVGDVIMSATPNSSSRHALSAMYPGVSVDRSDAHVVLDVLETPLAVFE